jgi:nanoRNase/pAp phosphatase (c-di-AMP/oligoRNAs hydrolase)
MRLVTRSDFDGLACAVLLVEKGIVDRYLFVHPKDIQDGKVEVTENDVLANIPYVPGCKMWFDHHISEDERLEMDDLKYEGLTKQAPSAAQLIWEFYGGEKGFGERFLPLLEAVNKSDSGDFNKAEILDPENWILLSFIMDARTGLGRFQDYRISNYQLMKDMIDYCRELTVEEILEIEDVQERVMRYFDQQDMFVKMIKENSRVEQNIVITDLKNQKTIYSGNRFIVYALFPDQNVDIRIMWGRDQKNVVFACGHSVLNKTCKTNIGNLMLQHGGGGHQMVGTCQVPIETWEDSLASIVEEMKLNG